jgi:hypothetical protein
MVLSFAFGFLSLCTAFGSFLFGIRHWKTLDIKLRGMVVLFFASVVADVLSLLLIRIKVTNLPVGNLYIIIQYIIIFGILDHAKARPALRLLFACCLLFSLGNFAFIQTAFSFNSYTFYATAITLMVAAIAYLAYLLTELPSERIQSFPMFWIAFGTLAYYSGTMFLFLFNNQLVEHFPQTHQRLWVVHNTLGILKNVFFFLSLWVNYRNQASQS